MSGIRNILIVCTGNSCRSVMAAGLLKKLLRNKGDYKIETAGTSASAGMPATDETIQVMSEHNIDVSEHLSTPLSEKLICEADLILVMEKRHKELILLRKYISRDKVHLLSEFGRIEKEDRLVHPDIPDPIGRPLQYYRRVFSIIEEAVRRTAGRLKAQ